MIQDHLIPDINKINLAPVFKIIFIVNTIN